MEWSGRAGRELGAEVLGFCDDAAADVSDFGKSFCELEIQRGHSSMVVSSVHGFLGGTDFHFYLFHPNDDRFIGGRTDSGSAGRSDGIALGKDEYNSSPSFDLKLALRFESVFAASPMKFVKSESVTFLF